MSPDISRKNGPNNLDVCLLTFSRTSSSISNNVMILTLHFTGQPVPLSRLRTGRKWILEDADLVSCVRYYRDGALTLRDWLGGYRGIQECAWYAADDIVPFLRMCPSLVVRPLRKIFRTIRALFSGFRKRFGNGLAALAVGQPAARD